LQINPHQQLARYRSDLANKGFSKDEIELAVKALPSAPVWTQTTPDFGFWDANRAKLMMLVALYQKNERVHGCIDIIAKSVTNAGCQLMKVVDKADKSNRKKAIAGKRWQRLERQWHVSQLARKSLQDDDGLMEIDEHPMLDAIKSIAENQNLPGLLRMMVQNLCIFGISFFLKNRNSLGNVVSYKYLPAYNVSPDRGKDGKIAGWFFSTTYGEAIPKNQPIAIEDMLIVRFPSLTDPHAGGDSPLESALRQVGLFDKMLDWQDWTFGNRGRMDGTFIPKIPDSGTLSTDEANRIEKRINDKFRGPGNGRWAVAEMAGQFVPMTWGPTDLATLEVEDKVATAVMFALNVPEAFGNNDGNRANLEGSLEQFARFCIAPIISLIEAAFNSELKDEFDTTDSIFVFENVIPEDKAFALEEDKVEIQAWQTARQNGDVTANEYRVNVLGLEEDPELDKEDDLPPPIAPPVSPPPASAPTLVPPPPKEQTEPAAKQPDLVQTKSFDLIALNKLVSKSIINRATAICIASHEMSMPEEEVKRMVTHPMAKKVKRKIPKRLPPIKEANTDDLEQAIKHQIGKQESAYLGQCETIGKGLSPELTTKLRKDVGDSEGGDATAEASADGGDENNNTTVATSGDDLPPNFVSEDAWDAADMMAYKPYLQIIAERVANDRIRMLTGIGAEPESFSVVQPNLDKAVAKASLKFAESTNDTTEKDLNTALEQLRQEILDGAIEGDPPTHLRRRVQGVFENIGKDRAQLIAKTEGSRASHEAQRITAKASGIIKGFRLLASSACCDECAELDGTEVGMDEQFLDSDYDDSILPVHPNCRCTMTEIIDLDAMEDEDES
jgi:SPP1 gp7 family putative phage head morphogenesis protein